MQRLCRACLDHNGEDESKSVQLFEAVVQGVTIGTLLHELFNIEISKEDNLPQSICQPCFLEVQTVFDFKEKLLKSDEALRSACNSEGTFKNEEHLLEEAVLPCSPTTTSSGLKDHEYTTIEIIPRECCVCENVSHNEHRTDISVSDTSSNKQICFTCSKQFNSGKDNDAHSKLNYIEEIVRFAAHDKQPVQRNDIQHSSASKSQRFCCITHCKQMFCNESDLLKHALDAHSLKIRWNEERQELGKSYKCNVCRRAFNSPKNLRIHQFVRTNQHSKQYACQECPFRAVSNALLIIHERSHTGERPFGCSLCSKRFYSELNLKNHQTCHQTERAFACSFCFKKFARKRNMEEHVRSCHSDERPHHCDVCSAQFKVQQHLRLHRRLHTGEKPYNCSYCSNSFYHISDRRRHEMSHTGEKPYSCKTCGLSYTRKRTLAIHERTHTGERPFSCNDCGKTFNQSSLLKRHIARHRNSEFPEHTANDARFNVEIQEGQTETFSIEETIIIAGK